MAHVTDGAIMESHAITSSDKTKIRVDLGSILAKSPLSAFTLPRSSVSMITQRRLIREVYFDII